MELIITFSGMRIKLHSNSICLIIFYSIKSIFQATKNTFLGEIFLKLFFILKKILLRWNLTITLILTTKSNFTLSYPNKNYFLKLIFDILKSNIN